MTSFVANRPIVTALIGALLLISTSFALKRLGIDATRALEIVTGLGLAFYSNFIPKNVAQVRGKRGQSVVRFTGYAFTLAGLGMAAAWGVLPIPAATPATLAIVGSALVLSFGYMVWVCTRRRA